MEVVQVGGVYIQCMPTYLSTQRPTNTCKLIIAGVLMVRQ